MGNKAIDEAKERVSNETLLQHNTVSYPQHKHTIDVINIATVHQANRYNSSIKNNGNISNSEIKRLFNLSPEVKTLLSSAADRLNVSARSYFKIIKVARTIADLENSSEIEPCHIAEALQYRLNTT